MILVFLALRLAVLFSYLDGLYEPEELTGDNCQGDYSRTFNAFMGIS